MVTTQTWGNVAPFWDLFENEGTSPVDLRAFQESFSPPLLVVGAGQGILVENLSQLKFLVVGVDYCALMVKEALRRRGLHLIHADATALPFESGSFSTIVVATGVLHAECEIVNQRILQECSRVAKSHATFLIGFPSPAPQQLETMRAMGVCSGWHQSWNRIVDIWEAQADWSRLSYLLADWRTIGREEARAEIVAHLAEYKAIAYCLDKWAERLSALGRCPKTFFREEVSFSQQFFHPSLIRSILRSAGLQLFTSNYSECRTATHALCRIVD